MCAEDLYYALQDVALAARRDKIPGPLARPLLAVAHMTLELFRRDQAAAGRFAAMVLNGPTNLRATMGQVSEDTVRACFRLIRLLEHLAEIHGS